MKSLIEKKVQKKELSFEEIEYIIKNYLNDQIKDYQVSALLMAITLNGMTEQEIINLTEVMINSGESIDLSKIKKSIIDKHSTGGVGDKTTLILAPIVAATGLAVAKMSGKGLGHTGGTIDKLNSIYNFKTNILNENFINQVNEIGLAIISQSRTLVPADAKLYSLRDVTGTVSSIPLIATSIMSKKIASGSNKIVIDVKIGKGALINNLRDARKLANLMIKIGKHYKKEVVCLLTNMDYPLGNTVGNGLEIKETIKFLQGEYEQDLYELVITLATIMVAIGKEISEQEALKEVEQVLKDGSAYNKFLEFIKYQNGNIDNILISKNYQSIRSPKTGFINDIDALKMGKIVNKLGGGRNKKEDEIDYGVGIQLTKKVGDYVLENEELLKVYYNKYDIHIKEILDCYQINLNPISKPNIIYELIK